MHAHTTSANAQVFVEGAVIIVNNTFALFTYFQNITNAVQARRCVFCMLLLLLVLISLQVDDEAWGANINQEVACLLSQVNIEQLLKVASSLRDGVPCQYVPGKHVGDGAIMGCANHHFWIIFEDGVKWIVRIPRTSNFSDMPLELVDYLVESEYATLKFLETTKVPSPKVFGYGLANDPANTVAVGYILEEVMQGTPFYTHEATEEQKKHVYGQYTEILADISRHKRLQAGSLQIYKGKPHPGPIASNRFISLGLAVYRYIHILCIRCQLSHGRYCRRPVVSRVSQRSICLLQTAQRQSCSRARRSFRVHERFLHQARR